MVSNLVDIFVIMFLILSGSCLLCFAKDHVRETDRKALDTDLINFARVFSFIVCPIVLYAGAKMMYSQLSVKVHDAKQGTSDIIRKALGSLAAADDKVFQGFVMNLSEWDYHFVVQCASVICFEYFGELTLRSGYTTVALDHEEKTSRVTASRKQDGTQGEVFV